MPSLRGLRRLNRYEARVLRIAKLAGKLATVQQIGFSAKSPTGFRFPIHSLCIGKPAAFQRSCVGFTAGVHGLETIGIRILLDFLENIFEGPDHETLQALMDGDTAIACIPIINPGGVAMKRRSNPASVDLMRNSGRDGEAVVPFFGGHRLSKSLPYFRGHSLQPETRSLLRFFHERFSNVKKGIFPILDVHSGFGVIDSVWWPFAGQKMPPPDHYLFRKLTQMIQTEGDGIVYEPQSQAYRVHGDLWDRVYEESISKRPDRRARMLPFTLEIGTWSDVKRNPKRLLSKRGLFNPPSEKKAEVIVRYRGLLSRFTRLPVLYSG